MKKIRTVILGAGESGTGAAVLAKKQSFDVFVSDFGEIKQKYIDILKKNNIEFEQKKHTEKIILSADKIIKSPGISDKADIIQKIIKNNIPIISEIEFASQYTDAHKICITGSNGKTTTTMLTYHIFKKAGLNVGLAGNVGESFAMQVANNDFDYYIIELSSFQLDNIVNFKAETAILLNITPDHLDRYNNNFDEYAEAKFNIIKNQTENDSFIYCSDDPEITDRMKKKEIKSKKIPFSAENIVTEGAFFRNNKINIKLNKTQFDMDIDKLALQGTHNAYNSMAAGISAKLAEIRNETLRESFGDFKGVEHRLEKFMKIRGVEFINDSKATNINSVWYALQSMQENVIWILGGIDKGNDYDVLKDLVRNKVKAIITLGIDNSKIHNAFIGMTQIYDTKSMDAAVNTAYSIAEKGDTVLLSPACASFDLFENYEERGEKFKKAVNNLY